MYIYNSVAKLRFFYFAKKYLQTFVDIIWANEKRNTQKNTKPSPSKNANRFPN